MKKYLYVYAISLQNVLQRRATLLMDRVGGVAVMVALYFFWSALLTGRESFAGYTRDKMLTYVLLVNILRSFVFTGRGWELVQEISSGRISSYLVRPLNYQSYALALDMAQKTIHLCAGFFEIGVLILLFDAPFYAPKSAETWLLFFVSAAISSLIFFLLEFLVASLAFWTSESAGPLFCFEIFVQFSSGAFFPIDVLPPAAQKALAMTPFPYVVYQPISIYLERSPLADALWGLAAQGMWLMLIAAAAAFVWSRGVRTYAAEGG